MAAKARIGLPSTNYSPFAGKPSSCSCAQHTDAELVCKRTETIFSAQLHSMACQKCTIGFNGFN